MQIRILGGWKRVALAWALAGLFVAPAGAKSSSESVGQPGNDGSKAVEPIQYVRSNYVWPFSSGPVYGTVDASRWTATGVLHTQVGSFDLTRGLPDFPNELRSANKLDKVASQYFLLQVKPEAFADGTFDAMKSAIAAQGGAIVSEMPIAAFVVRMTPGAYLAITDSPSIIALVPYPPAFKLSPEIGRLPLLDAVKAASSVYSLELQLFPGESNEGVTGSLTAMGLRVKGNYSNTVFVDADRSQLAAIAALDPVVTVNEVLPIFLMGPYTSVGLDGGGGEKCCPGPLGPQGPLGPHDPLAPCNPLDRVCLQGDDQILMIIDSGIQLDAADLSEARTNAGDDGSLPTGVSPGHRKVLFYGTTALFVGTGDILGCDADTTSGVTHGHAVAAVALGNATRVLGAAYGSPVTGSDPLGNPLDLDGVAPQARLVVYDGQITPLNGSCSIPQNPAPLLGLTQLDPGDLYATAPFHCNVTTSTVCTTDANCPGEICNKGALTHGYERGARTVNFSWGTVANSYDTNSSKIDAFLTANSDAMVFVSAGNSGRDKNGDLIPDPNTIAAPATAKNIVCIGAGDASTDTRLASSSNGPATIFSNRIAPLLMAPGNGPVLPQDPGSSRRDDRFGCRSFDNGQTNPVDCDALPGENTTSMASAAAAGAALLVRDYFAQGFYPDATITNPGNSADKVPTIAGALVKAILVASADWMNASGSNLPGGNLTKKFRGNREQGFGLIQPANALPLQSYPGAVSGLIVGDGGPGPAGLVNSTTLSLSVPSGGNSGTYTLNVCDPSQPLTVVISWIDPTASDALGRDLNLEVTSPSGRLYLGNFFTDDTNDNGAASGTEDCTYSGQPWPPDSIAGIVDTGPWSLPAAAPVGVTCTPANHVDPYNNVEAVFLSPDSRLNGINDDPSTAINESSDNQVEQGAWTVIVKAPGTNPSAQSFSIAIAGGVCQRSAVRIQKVFPSNQVSGAELTCNDSAVITVDEVGTAGDPLVTLTATEVASRTTVQVVAEDGVTVTDTETLLAADFPTVTTAGSSIRFVSRKILLTDGTAPEPGNGALDVRNGQSIRVTYQDEEPFNTVDLNLKRIAATTVGCRPAVSSGGVVFGQFGKDAFTLVDGGCEKDARGYFTFGFPDHYMDEGELVSYLVAFQSAEAGTDLVNASVSLRAVFADTNSPANCNPGSVGTCADPNRIDNTCASSKPQTTTPPVVCGTAVMTILDSPKVYGLLPGGKTITPSFTIQMNAAITGIQKVDMLIGVAAKTAGMGVDALLAKREVLNVDEFAFFYSTDFPLGGAGAVSPFGAAFGFTGNYDINNNEILEAATNDPHNVDNDYFVETQAYSDMTATNPLAVIKAPWTFDTNNGGFVNGLQNTSHPSPAAIAAQWGEDKNYNGKLDGFCTSDTALPCTQGIPASAGCGRCSLNKTRECLVDVDCQNPLPNEGTCVPQGTCDYSLGEDRNPMNGALDTSWSTAGGCGWQTKAPSDATGGVWHTGLVRAPNTGTCLAVGNDPGDCQMYFTTPDGDLVGDNNWWELLVTPVLHKVNQGLDASGDPLYQVTITDWAWNMAVDIPDANTSITLEFDNDINKTTGAQLFNDLPVLAVIKGPVGAVSGGDSTVTGGFSMFARPSHCVDTDGNGSRDHCGTAIGKLCGSNKAQLDLECTGNDISPNRGQCLAAPATSRCTGNPNLVCVGDSDCNKHCSLQLTKACNAVGGSVNNTCIGPQGTCIDDAAVNGTLSLGERCVPDYTICSVDGDCSVGVCSHLGGTNREGKNNCIFEGKTQPGPTATALEPYGLASPPDDDLANGYCQRSDGLNGIDKSIPCSSARDCDASGVPYATVRSCSLQTSRICTSNTGCLLCTLAPTKSCATNADCVSGEGVCNATLAGACTNTVYTSVCDLTNHTGAGSPPNTPIDAFVQTNGPGRNSGIKVSSGLDMQNTQLEDLYGDTGTQFQAALGFNNRESDVNTQGRPPGLGVAVDDMVISWKETRLDVDTHDCAGSGECATLESGSSVSYEGNSVVSLTVTDKTPYDSVNVKNDCNGDGDFADGTDDTDCNNNGANDVTVKLTSDAEVPGEIAILDETSPGSHVYKANYPYSSFFNSPGTLFVVQAGTSFPIVTARYEDRDTIPGATDERCKNALDPTKTGFITSTTTVSSTSGRIVVNSYSVVLAARCSVNTTKDCTLSPPGGECVGGDGVCSLTPGDDDGFADTNETINLVVVFKNQSGVDVDDLQATLGTNSPNIECITRPSIAIGSLANRAVSNPALYLPFQFKVANVNRSTITEALQAVFTLTVRSNKFDALTRATQIPLDLDYNASGGTGSSIFSEDFEAGFGKFTRELLDAGKNNLVASNDFRCQYNDPFGLNSNDSTNTDCFLGFAGDPSTGVNDWHIHTSSVATMGVGRAFNGKQSLHLGVHNFGLPAYDTTRLKHIMSVKTVAPVNLPLAGANPELYFAQQVSFVDHSSGFPVTKGEAVDRGVVEIKPSAPANAPWIKIYPYVNIYDEQATDDFANCLFDPTDDGNNEDSFFDPTDPARRLGPSSTCFPEFTFAHQGQTDYRKRFDAADIGNASDGPGLQGCCSDATGCLDPGHANCLPANTPSVISNPGTWIQTRFSLAPYAGRSIFVRFLATSMEFGAANFWGNWFGTPNVSGDDGWYIDDVNITGLLGAGTANAITLSVDTAVIAPLSCGACSAVTATLTATPATSASPGQIVTLSAKDSTVDRCNNGVLQFQFWNDVNFDGIVGVGPDILLRDWTDNSTFIDAPQLTTKYGVKARCSSDTSCDSASNSTSLLVPVTCPTSTASLGSLRVNKPTLGGQEPDTNSTISWGGSITVEVIRGDLTALRSSGGITNVDAVGCLVNNLFVPSVVDNAIVGSGASYYLMQTAQFCNVALSGAYSEGLPSEKPGAANNRDGDIGASPNACP